MFHLQKVLTQYLLKFKFHCYIACGSPLKNISSFQWSYNLGIRCLQMISSLQKSYSKYSPLYKLWKHWSPHQIHKNVAAHLDLMFFERTSHRNAMYSNRYLSYTIQSSTVNSIWVHTNTFHRNTAGCSLRIHSKARGFVKHMCSKCANCFSMLMEFHKKRE